MDVLNPTINPSINPGLTLKLTNSTAVQPLTLSCAGLAAGPFVSTELLFGAVVGAGPRLEAPPADRPLPSAASRLTPAPVGAPSSESGGAARFPGCAVGGGDPCAPRVAAAGSEAWRDPTASAEDLLPLCAACTSGREEGGAGAAAAWSDGVCKLLLSLIGVPVPCAVSGDPVPCESQDRTQTAAMVIGHN